MRICAYTRASIDDLDTRYTRGEMMREKEVEQYLVSEVRKAGGKAYKFVSPGNTGVPDRIAVFPGGKIYFVELKAPGGKVRPQQAARFAELGRRGCKVWVLDSKLAVDGFLKKYGELENNGV